MDSAEREGLRQKGNVPNLRFPEFEGEWEKCKLGDLCNVLMCKRILASQTNTEEGVPFYKIGTIGNAPDAYISKELFDDYKTKYNYPHKGEVMITCAGTVGKCVIYDGKDAYYQDSNIVWIDNPSQCISNSFLYHLLAKVDWRKLNSTTIIRIYNDDLRNLKLNYPQIEEQQKISRLLSLLDERIATQNKVIDKLQSLIKGIVNYTILRKEQNATIGDVCSVSEQIRAEAKIDDIITVRLHGNGVCKSSAENLQLGATQYYRRRAGQLIYGKQNFHNGAIGIVPQSLDNGITSKDIPSFDIDKVKCNSIYLLAQLQSPQYYKPTEALTTGTGSKRLKEEAFLKMPIVLPNKREQDKIANLIYRASIDLDQAKRLSELFSTQKQYLLRQMFI